MAMSTNKVLLLGREHAGKTSMKSIIFGNHFPNDTKRLRPTIEIEHSRQQFLGNLQLDIWDCGGQPLFMKSYLDYQKPIIFSNVAIIIYVFDVAVLQTQQKTTLLSNQYYEFNNVLGAIAEYSPHAKIFCLIHKMDLIHMKLRNKIFSKYGDELQKTAKVYGQNVTCFATSIWDETLFKAWSYIIGSLLHNEMLLQRELDILCNKCNADEIILFESKTFLFIAHSKRKMKHVDFISSCRFERIATLIKQFKLRCLKANKSFQTITVSNTKFTAYIGPFTNNSYVLAVTSDPLIEIDAVKMNLKRGKNKFKKLLAIKTADKFYG